MTGLPVEPEVRFRVGAVRVTLWPGANTSEVQRITIDRKENEGAYTDVLYIRDITAAILGLKKAAQYVQSKNHRTIGDCFVAGDIGIRERLP